MIRDWYNLILNNGTLKLNLIEFKTDAGRSADVTLQVMMDYVYESHEIGDGYVVAQIVDSQLALHDPKADFIDGDTAPEEFVEIK